MISNTFRTIGQRLKKARESLGLTQEQVAQYLGENRVQISYYETGRREIDMETLIKLADLYGYSRAYFVEENPVEFPAFTVLRAEGLAEEDLDTIAMVNRFAKNLHYINSLLGGRS